MPLPVGDKLDHYEILAPIGAGGMGEVYRARDPRLNRDEVSGTVQRVALVADDLESLFHADHWLPCRFMRASAAAEFIWIKRC